MASKKLRSINCNAANKHPNDPNPVNILIAKVDLDTT